MVARAIKTLLALAALAATLSCAGGAAAPPPGAPAEEEGPVVGPPQVAWKDMTKEQRSKYMKAVVKPKMAALFAEFDPEFTEPEHKVTCKTCHGKGVEDHSFKMPNPEIKVLPGDEAGFKKLAEAKPKWVKFMGEKVEPQMAALLGLEPYDPANPKKDQFTCGGCHTFEGQPAPAHDEAPAAQPPG